jgi:hypothetical protein
MALFNEGNLRARAAQGVPTYKSFDSVLTEKVQASAGATQFDIFLSHSLSDQKLILGIWLSLEDLGYKVYVDWIHDKQLSRDSVTKETARVLRERMRSCKCLFFATTSNSSSSKWMPWELGFMDGIRNRAAILPIVSGVQSSYQGQEYLGIYPYVSKEPPQGAQNEVLWINASTDIYVSLDAWLKGSEPSRRG